MEVVKTNQISPILKDERGLFFEVVNKIDVKHIVVTTFTKGAIRGNQYRKNMDQYFFLISGKLKIITQLVNENTKKENFLTQGTMAYIPRGTAFVSVAEEKSILLEFSPQEYDPNNPDIYRFTII